MERSATVHEVVRLMSERRISSVIVERRDEDDEFGLVAVADIARDVLAKDLSPERVNVYEIMSKPVLTLAAEMNVMYAVRMLSRFQLARALVVDHDRNPLGVVTLRDMVLRSLEDE
ncbi:MAG: CBS domain-containing protein [Rhodospirillaceae bacterium]|nr:CBS domain-containing protein [Rhodospirillaceae bacterium]MBT5810142.1 CBS domain-containing protein [Rhodospirillaceae bacterium]